MSLTFDGKTAIVTGASRGICLAIAQRLVDDGARVVIQVHGGGSLSQDFPLAAAFAYNRTLRFADGPDEVHKSALARNELRRQATAREARAAVLIPTGKETP